MICPNCGLEQPDAPECKRCGVIVAKYQAQETRPRPSASAGGRASPPPAPPFFDMFNVILGVGVVIVLISFLIFRVDDSMSKFKICAVMFVILFLWWWWSGKKKRKELEGMAAELGGEVVMSSYGAGYYRLKTEAGEATVDLISGGGGSSKRRYLALRLEAKAPIGFSFAISKNNVGLRALAVLGMKYTGKEFKIGDPSFDQKYLIQGDDHTRITRFFQDPGRREAVEYFFRNGFHRLYTSPRKTSTPNAVIALKFRYHQADLEPELIRMHLEQLGKLIAA